jgi:predicted porin
VLTISLSHDEGITVRKLIICALALGGFAASAQAADLGLDSLKDPLPDTLSYKGVTLYGTVDIGYAYQTNGAPQTGSLYTGGLNLNMFGAAQNRQAISALSYNGLEQSKIGVKFEEQLGYGFAAIGKIETGFDPGSGMLADACASLVNNNGKATIVRDAGVDGGRCGQALNGPVYAGLSSMTYGTLTVGRQQSLELDAIASYDPMGLSYAFSLIGWSGGSAAGIGDTETARWDNSIKYAYQFGPLHAAAMYGQGADDASIQRDAYGFNLGGAYKGFSVDAVYTKENGAVGMSSLGFGSGAGQCGAGGVLCPTNALNATITDNEAWSIMGKYTYDLGGGFKDSGPGGRLTAFAGYVHIDMANPQDAVAPGSYTAGGYQMYTVNNQPFALGSDKILQTAWAGAKYETGPWAFTAAYYHLTQDAFLLNSAAGSTCAQQTNHNISVGAAGVKTGSNCGGNTDTVSGLVDYTFTKHFDVYGGVSWSQVDGGLSSGFIGGLDNTTVMTGMRLKF